MKKITQNLTNLKAWQSTIFAFLFLFSLTINAQEVGQEYIGNPDINTTETSPETGSNVTSGNFSGATNAGSWGFGQQGSYAPCGANPGCYSADRMFKMFKKNGENGQQYITQTITALPAGNYDWSYWNRWGANGGVFPTWSADGDETPKFVILTDDDGDGTWTSVQENENVSTEPTGSTWYQESGTYTNDIARDVKIKFTKTGGADSSGLTNLAHLWYLDNASLAYASALAPSAISTFPWNEGFESGLDSWTDGSSTPWATDNGTDYGPGSVTEGTTSIFFNDYDYSTGSTADIMSPVLDVTSLTAPLLTFDYWDSNGSDTVEVLVSDGTTTTVAYETAAAVGEWTSISVDLTAYSSSTLQVGFRGTSVYGVSNPHVDNVVVDAAPTEPSMSVSATTDGGSATFSFDISNFTVGAAAGEGDGHIHWSIFSASDLENPIYENQMVYSTDDLTLSPLPNGDHVIVFSLVDASHQPLDPAVEATVEFSTFDGTAACDETVTYTQVANGDYTVALTAPAGQVASVTVNATMENNYDFIYVTDGAGNALNADQTTGAFTDAVYSSTDGTISVNVTNDGSVQNGDVILAFACATPTFDVTFSVNTANIEVGANGMYVGGGVLGGANAYPLTDDGTGTWSATITLDEGTAGNYIFLNSPANDSDWNTKENLDGQECGDPANYNDRTLAAVTADTTLLHCFGSCETDGTCPSPADTYATTFTVNVTDGYVDYDGNTQAIGDNIVYLNGNFNGWCGACNPMTDNGDGTWSSTVELEAGAYEYKFTVNGWDGAQEEWTADFAATEEGSCLITDGTYTNRALTVTDSAQTLSTVSWNSCTDATTSTVGIDPGCSDFDSGTEGWTVVDAGGLTSDWLLDETAEGGANESTYSMGHGYLPSDAAYNDWLVSPAYNTTGLSAPTLSYWEHLNWSADAQAHNVYYSTDYAGDATTATWNLLTDVIGADAEDTWTQRSFALPSADNVVVSFQYNATYGADWNIDDVCIQEDTLSTVDATVLDMRIYPNPSNGSFVTIQTPVNGVKYVEVFDITGKRLMNTSLSANTLDVSSISAGMYLVKVTIEGQSKTSKLIIR